jgi:hypothetical protein
LELVAAMPALLQKTLKIVPAPLVIEAVPKALPVLESYGRMQMRKLPCRPDAWGQRK